MQFANIMSGVFQFCKKHRWACLNGHAGRYLVFESSCRHRCQLKVYPLTSTVWLSMERTVRALKYAGECDEIAKDGIYDNPLKEIALRSPNEKLTCTETVSTVSIPNEALITLAGKRSNDVATSCIGWARWNIAQAFISIWARKENENVHFSLTATLLTPCKADNSFGLWHPRRELRKN